MLVISISSNQSQTLTSCVPKSEQVCFQNYFTCMYSNLDVYVSMPVSFSTTGCLYM